jgi:hypothetical protein
MDFTNIPTQVAIILGQTGLTVSVTVDGTAKTAVKTALNREAVAMDSGLAQSYDFSVVIAGTVAATPMRSVCTLAGKTYRVLGVETDTLGSSTTLHLGNKP